MKLTLTQGNAVVARAHVARAPRAFSSGLVRTPLRLHKAEARRAIKLQVKAMIREW